MGEFRVAFCGSFVAAGIFNLLFTSGKAYAAVGRFTFCNDVELFMAISYRQQRDAFDMHPVLLSDTRHSRGGREGGGSDPRDMVIMQSRRIWRCTARGILAFGGIGDQFGRNSVQFGGTPFPFTAFPAGYLRGSSSIMYLI